MKHLIWVLCFELFACGPQTPPNPLGWQWRATVLLCQQAVDFSATSGRDLPKFTAEHRLGFCQRTVFYLRLHREFGEHTAFFGVAAITTAGLATLYGPGQRHRYSPETWDFMSGLSGDLAERAITTANRLRRGTKGLGLTRQLLEREQSHVGQVLADLRRREPVLYTRLIGEIDQTLNPDDPLVLAAINSQPFFATYLAAIAEVRDDVGVPVRFDLQTHRVAVGMALSKSFSGRF